MATTTTATPTATGSDTGIGQWRYFNNPEEGDCVTKVWFKVVAPSEDKTFGSIIAIFDKSKTDGESDKVY